MKNSRAALNVESSAALETTASRFGLAGSGQGGKPVNVKIRGKRWRLRFVGHKELPRGTDAECDSPSLKGKEIRVRQSLSGMKRLDRIIHECLHAGHWDLSEDAVDEMAHDLAHILGRLGYEAKGIE